MRAGEPLHGTAVAATTTWLLLQVEQPWGPRGYDDLHLPPAVKEHLDRALRTVSGTRVQLVRRPGRHESTGVTLMVVVDGGIHRAQLERLEDVVALDVAALLQGRSSSSVTPGGRVALVCTHGKRDRCCAQLGRPVFDAVVATNAVDTWQTTHLGGHRFAPTLVFLPEGLSFGRLQPEEIEALVADYLQGRIGRLDRFRGRTCYESAVQAADCFLRDHTGVSNVADVRLEAVAESSGDRTAVTMTVVGYGQFVVTVQRESLAMPVVKSCGGPAEATAHHTLGSLRRIS